MGITLVLVPSFAFSFSLSPNTKNGNWRQLAATLGQHHHHLYQTTQYSIIKVVGGKSLGQPTMILVSLGDFLQARR